MDVLMRAVLGSHVMTEKLIGIVNMLTQDKKYEEHLKLER